MTVALATTILETAGLHRCAVAKTTTFCGCAPGNCVESAPGLIDSAIGWLYRVNDAGSIMTAHGLEQAADLLDRAAEQLPTMLATETRALASRCRRAVYVDDLLDVALVLRKRVVSAPNLREVRP